MTHSTGSVLVLERQTVHISDDSGRIAMLEKRIIGTDDAEEVLTRYVYSNHLQSASLELDGIGDIISYEEYHPYGTTAFQAKNASINAVAKRYRYTGKERDEESGLYYHGARYYIPWLCKWTAIDPMESKYAGMSPYSYSFNNPVMWNDLNGADPDEPPLPAVDNTAYNPVNPYEEPKEYGHLTPDGGRIRFPRGVTITKTVDEGEQFVLNGATVNLELTAGSVFSFAFEGNEYFAHIDANNKFVGYFTLDNKYFITYDSSNLPYNLNTKEAGAMFVLGWTTAGQAAMADGPEPGPGDAAGLLFGTGASLLSLIALFDAASGYVKMSRPGSSTVFIEDVSEEDENAVSEGSENIEEKVQTTKLEPEPGYRKGKKHGIGQQDGDAERMAKESKKPIGRWGNKADLEYAGEKAGTLEPGEMQDFPINEGSKSTVFNPDGTRSVPDMIRVRNNGNGTFHGFPINSGTAGPIYKK